MTEDEKLIEELEKSGLISKGIANSLRAARNVTDAAGRKRVAAFRTVMLAVLVCLLSSASKWAYDPFPSASLGLCFAAIFVCVGLIASAIHWVELR